MNEFVWSILFVVFVLLLLSYSCRWFGKSMRTYQDARREFEEDQRRIEEQIRRNQDTPPGYNDSVFTVENGYHNHLGLYSQMPPRSPAHLVLKELPPTYDDALRLQTAQTVTPPVCETNVTVQRRTSV